MLNKNNESEYTCLVPDPEANASSLSSLSYDGSPSFGKCPFFHIEDFIPIFLTVFIRNRFWILLDIFFASIEIII